MSQLQRLFHYISGEDYAEFSVGTLYDSFMPEFYPFHPAWLDNSSKAFGEERGLRGMYQNAICFFSLE